MSQMTKLFGHHHPLLTDRYIEYRKWCSVCDCPIIQHESNYWCKICKDWWHTECMPTSPELVNHPYHPNHPLKLFVDEAPDYADDKCHFCRKKITNFIYHCYLCNFSLDVRCGTSPEHLMIDESKCHDHPLTVMVRQVSFVCNACGTHGKRNPYVCVACSFMVHQECIHLPHVININRHDHRISHTYSLGPGSRICIVCRLNVDWIYGAYSCSKCPDFVVHSKCATSCDLWDGQELEGVEEEEEEEPMFKMIEDGVINHVKHPSHNLKLTDNDVLRDQGVRCQFCEGPVYSDKFYSCMECDYFLHETCAYLPNRKRLCFSSRPFILKEAVKEASMDKFAKCLACKRLSTGYMYTDHIGDKTIDLRCAAVDWWCDHECHPHTLFLTNLQSGTCGACNYHQDYVLRCVECKFKLCYKCATYPKKIKHRCDDHPLVLSFGDKEQHGINWCTVCEAKIDLQRWFYECEDCGIVCHIQCVLGDFTNFNPELDTTGLKKGEVLGVVSNNGSTRPHCRACATHCLAPFIYSFYDGYLCSLACFEFERNILEEEKRAVGYYIQKAALQFIDASARR